MAAHLNRDEECEGDGGRKNPGQRPCSHCCEILKPQRAPLKPRKAYISARAPPPTAEGQQSTPSPLRAHVQSVQQSLQQPPALQDRAAMQYCSTAWEIRRIWGTADAQCRIQGVPRLPCGAERRPMPGKEGPAGQRRGGAKRTRKWPSLRATPDPCTTITPVGTAAGVRTTSVHIWPRLRRLRRQACGAQGSEKAKEVQGAEGAEG